MRKITLFIALLFFATFNYSAQAVESHTVACTAGNLATVAASYLTTVTNLTVTGTIDARDFKTMRDAMPLLEEIDLSGATVEAYTGTEGTYTTTSRSYPENGIPAFAFCTLPNSIGKLSLKSFIYPSSITIIGKAAFYGCSSLFGKLVIPSTVVTIDDYAFGKCRGFTGILTIPSSVVFIGIQTFANCTGLTGPLTIPSSVTSLGELAFSVCKGLTGPITFSSSINTIQNSTFGECIGLTGSLTIPSTVNVIGLNSFTKCSGITSLTISSSVNTITDYAFWGCTGLAEINIYASVPINMSASLNAFTGINKTTCVLHVPMGSKALYQNATLWKDFTNIVDDVVITSIDEVHDSKTISIYPNPATSHITISELSSLVADKTVKLSVIDVLGTMLMVNEVDPTVNTLPIDVSTLRKGIYFISVQTSNGSVVKRFVKE